MDELVGVVMHHLWLQLHLKLLAGLPEGFDGFFEGEGVFCVAVYRLVAYKYVKRMRDIPSQALDELANQVLNTRVLLVAL